MILAAGAPSGVFSLISLPSLDQSRHGTYQMKAEYLNLSNDIIYIIAANIVENLTNKEYKKIYFLHSYF